jgi:phosphosulfolactate phosphohydrolase-like enzyme
VVDVLRATSTIVQALAVGYSSVVCCRSVATARELRSPGRVLAGESACVRVSDFELGNSPAAMATAGRRGEELVLAGHPISKERDIAWCARESVLEVVPEVWSIDDGAAVVAPAVDSHRDNPMKSVQEFA